MKRDMDLAREILKTIEISKKDPSDIVSKDTLYKRGYEEPQVSEHIKILVQAGLILAIDATSTNNGTLWEAQSLTWDGHDFLDAARNDKIWKKAKNITLEKTGGLAFDVLKGVLIQLGKKALDSAMQS